MQTNIREAAQQFVINGMVVDMAKPFQVFSGMMKSGSGHSSTSTQENFPQAKNFGSSDVRRSFQFTSPRIKEQMMEDQYQYQNQNGQIGVQDGQLLHQFKIDNLDRNIFCDKKSEQKNSQNKNINQNQSNSQGQKSAFSLYCPIFMNKNENLLYQMMLQMRQQNLHPGPSAPSNSSAPSLSLPSFRYPSFSYPPIPQVKSEHMPISPMIKKQQSVQKLHMKFPCPNPQQQQQQQQPQKSYARVRYCQASNLAQCVKNKKTLYTNQFVPFFYEKQGVQGEKREKGQQEEQGKQRTECKDNQKEVKEDSNIGAMQMEMEIQQGK